MKVPFTVNWSPTFKYSSYRFCFIHSWRTDWTISRSLQPDLSASLSKHFDNYVSRGLLEFRHFIGQTVKKRFQFTWTLVLDGCRSMLHNWLNCCGEFGSESFLIYLLSKPLNNIFVTSRSIDTKVPKKTWSLGRNRAVSDIDQLSVLCWLPLVVSIVTRLQLILGAETWNCNFLVRPFLYGCQNVSLNLCNDMVLNLCFKYCSWGPQFQLILTGRILAKNLWQTQHILYLIVRQKVPEYN